VILNLTVFHKKTTLITFDKTANQNLYSAAHI